MPELTFTPIINSSVFNDENITGPPSNEKYYPRLKITARGDTLETEYFDPIADNVSVTWSTVDIPGRSTPLFAYSKTQGQTFDVKFYLWCNTSYTEVSDDAKWLKSLAYPKYTSGLTLPPPIVHIELEGVVDFDCVVNSVNITYKDAYHDKKPLYAEVSLNIAVTSIIPFSYTDIVDGKVPTSTQLKTIFFPPILKQGKKLPIKELPNELKITPSKYAAILENMNDILDTIKSVKDKVKKIKRITSQVKHFANDPNLGNLSELLTQINYQVGNSNAFSADMQETMEALATAGASVYQMEQEVNNIVTTTSYIASDLTSIKKTVGI